MNDLANATPAPGSTSGLPAPTGAPDAVAAPVAPETPPVAAPVAPAPAPLVQVETNPQPAVVPPTAPVEIPAEPAPEAGFSVQTGNEYADGLFTQLHADGVDIGAFLAGVGDSDTIALEHLDASVLEDKYGPLAANAIMDRISTEFDSAASEEQAAREAVYAETGGEAGWQALATWLATPDSGITPEGWEQYNVMLNQGGVSATLAARELFTMYQNSPGFVQPTELIQGQAPAGAAPFEPVGRTEYSQEYKKIMQEEGENSPKLEALDRRRMASREQGIL